MQKAISLPILAIFFPLLTACINQVITERQRLAREIWLIAASAVHFVIMLLLTRNFDVCKHSIKLFDILPNISIAWHLDKAGLVFALCVSFLWMCNTLYATFYMPRHKKIKNFFTLITITVFLTINVAFAANMVTLFFAYELMTYTTYPLIQYHKTPQAKKAATIYLCTLVFASIALLLPAITYIFNLNPAALDFHNTAPLNLSHDACIALMLILVYGAAKAALWPVHFWLPLAMVAPTPVSALLHAVAVVKTGVFTIVRIAFFIIHTKTHLKGPIYPLFYLASFSIIYAGIRALKQDDLKKILAYSTISQLSYIILATSMLNNRAFAASIIHIVAHAVAKIALFFCAGIIYHQTGKKEVSRMQGIAKNLPVTATCFAFAAASIIGIPPTIGFVSKYQILRSLETCNTLVAIAIFATSTVLNVLYLLPPAIKFFQKNPDQNAATALILEPHWLMLCPLILTTLATILLTLVPIMHFLT